MEILSQEASVAFDAFGGHTDCNEDGEHITRFARDADAVEQQKRANREERKQDILLPQEASERIGSERWRRT